jgi:hypothetical protein
MSLHADVAVPARDRRRLERLCHYVARPALASDRLEERPDGGLALRLKTPTSRSRSSWGSIRMWVVPSRQGLVCPELESAGADGTRGRIWLNGRAGVGKPMRCLRAARRPHSEGRRDRVGAGFASGAPTAGPGVGRGPGTTRSRALAQGARTPW